MGHLIYENSLIYFGFRSEGFLSIFGPFRDPLFGHFGTPILGISGPHFWAFRDPFWGHFGTPPFWDISGTLLEAFRIPIFGISGHPFWNISVILFGAFRDSILKHFEITFLEHFGTPFGAPKREPEMSQNKGPEMFQKRSRNVPKVKIIFSSHPLVRAHRVSSHQISLGRSGNRERFLNFHFFIPAVMAKINQGSRQITT